MCQQFVGEREPFARVRPIAEFYGRLLSLVSEHAPLDVDEEIAAGRRLGLRDLDLAILQA